MKKYWKVEMWQPTPNGMRPVLHWIRDGRNQGRTACGVDARNYYAYKDGAEITCPECKRLYEEAEAK